MRAETYRIVWVVIDADGEPLRRYLTGDPKTGVLCKFPAWDSAKRVADGIGGTARRVALHAAY